MTSPIPPGYEMVLYVEPDEVASAVDDLHAMADGRRMRNPTFTGFDEEGDPIVVCLRPQEDPPRPAARRALTIVPTGETL